MSNKFEEVNYPVMSREEATVLSFLPKGKSNAIKAQTLSDLIGINERTVRLHIRRLRMVFHQPICSNPGAPAGFYVAQTREELYECFERQLKFGLRNMAMAQKLWPQRWDIFTDQIIMRLEVEVKS